MIGPAVEKLIEGLGDLGDEQLVHAESARRLAGLLDEDAPAYTVPALARELRAAVAALQGALLSGRGVDEDDLDAALRSL